jgi:hypothetical protein
MGMADIKRGESLLIPFRNGKSIYDSQNKPRIYKTRKGFEKHFPGHYLGKDGVELVEYVEVVRCKDCRHWIERTADGVDSFHVCWFNGSITGRKHFCVYGERRTET